MGRRALMKVAVTGSSGLIGSALYQFLTAHDHEVIRVVRKPAADPATVFWDPLARIVEKDRLEGLDAVVHLASENVAGRRWSERQKAIIRDSRVAATDLLATSLAGLSRPPSVLVSASAVAIYGDRGSEILTEASVPGRGFGAAICRDWEAATAPAEAAGIRVVHLRTGIVLDSSGGGLKKMLPLFRSCLGGPTGSGTQYMSWISMDDEIRAIHHTLRTDTINGPVNLTGPTPVTNRTFVKSLARRLRRPAVLPIPASGARLLLGSEMAGELLLSSQRAIPEKLLSHGFTFWHTEIPDALRRALAT
jgi:uncharacterized protein (TIGR01777 family)